MTKIESTLNIVNQIRLTDAQMAQAQAQMQGEIPENPAIKRILKVQGLEELLEEEE